LNDSQLHICTHSGVTTEVYFQGNDFIGFTSRKGEVRSRDTKMIPLNVPYSALKGRALFSLIFFTSPGLLAAENSADNTKKPLTRP
jgi:iron complex outermembrane receptor protein